MTLQQVYSMFRDFAVKNQIPMLYRYHRLLSFSLLYTIFESLFQTKTLSPTCFTTTMQTRCSYVIL